MSSKTIKGMYGIVRTMIEKVTNIAGLTEMSKLLTPRVRSWVNYYGKFRKPELGRLWSLINLRLAYRLCGNYKRVYRGLMQSRK